jgi:hypothetical protein
LYQAAELAQKILYCSEHVYEVEHTYPDCDAMNLWEGGSCEPERTVRREMLELEIGEREVVAEEWEALPSPFAILDIGLEERVGGWTAIVGL